MYKIFYDPNELTIVSIQDGDFKGSVSSELNSVFAETLEDLITHDLGGGVTDYIFPIDDLDKMKKIAHYTVDKYVDIKQGESFTYLNNTFSTTFYTRQNVMAKILELNITQVANTIFPNTYGIPVSLTSAEMMGLGVAMSEYIEGVYIEGLVKHGEVSAATSNETLVSIMNDVVTSF